jgi:hypothetical protein
MNGKINMMIAQADLAAVLRSYRWKTSITARTQSTRKMITAAMMRMRTRPT